ncbi:MAG: G5 domain-containing protein [Armatimonadetes bacterium]|nr:G5 domain-containing protein [Armatimonadota bacterium]
MDKEKTIHNLKMQLRLERIVIAAIALTLATVWTVGQLRGGKSFILVDGKPIVCVYSEKDAEVVLTQIKGESGCNPSEVAFQQEVRVARAPYDARPVSRSRAFSTVRKVVCALAPRWAIIVDGKPIAALPDKKTAVDTLEAAKMKFGSMVQNLAEEPQFKQKVMVDIAAVPLKLCCKTAEEAVNLIFSNKPVETTDAIYTVQNGDIAGAIAQKHGLKLEEIIQINPGVNLAHLHIGDKVHVKALRARLQICPNNLRHQDTEVKLTVIVRDLSDKVETIPAPLQYVSSAQLYLGKSTLLFPGRSGQRQIKVAIIYENGKKTGSEIMAEEVLREASPRIIAKGIKPRR